MSKLKKISDLDLYILNTKDPKPEEVPLVEKAYKLWLTSWEFTFRSQNVDIGKRLYSDDFLDRDVMALFYNGEPVALTFVKWFTPRKSQLDHSYFKHYPQSVIDHIKSMGNKRWMLSSYITCVPEWRKRFTDISLTEVMFSLSVKIFEKSKASYFIGYIRKDNDFHEVFYRHGGIKLGENNVYNSEVDYVYMTRESKRLSPLPGVAEMANALWEQMESRSKLVRHLKLVS